MINKNLQIQLSWIHLNLLKTGSLNIEKVILQSYQIFSGLTFRIRLVDEPKPAYVAAYMAVLEKWIEKNNPENISGLLTELERLIKY
jgi:hypothetical protein